MSNRAVGRPSSRAVAVSGSPFFVIRGDLQVSRKLIERASSTKAFKPVPVIYRTRWGAPQPSQLRCGP